MISENNELHPVVVQIVKDFHGAAQDKDKTQEILTRWIHSLQQHLGVETIAQHALIVAMRFCDHQAYFFAQLLVTIAIVCVGTQKIAAMLEKQPRQSKAMKKLVQVAAAQTTGTRLPAKKPYGIKTKQRSPKF